MTVKQLTPYAPLGEDPREHQEPRRIHKGDYFYPSGVLAEISADVRERQNDALRIIVAEKLSELTEGEDALFDRYVAIRLLKRAGYGKYLPSLLQD